MSKAAKSLAQWCTENNREDLLSEIDFDSNKKWYKPESILNRTAWNSPRNIYWKCKNGHKWICEINARTIFGLSCPECDYNSSVLPIGTKYGCLTIVGNYEDYYKERIAEIVKEKQEVNSNEKWEKVGEAEDINEIIERIYNRPKYICQCKCGKKHHLDQFDFLETKHRFCTPSITKEDEKQFEMDKEVLSRVFNKHYNSFDDYISGCCGLAIEAWKKKQQAYKENGSRSYAANYDTDYTGSFFESLEVLKCIDENYEEPDGHRDLRRKDAYSYKIYKLYKCRCYLCGKEHKVKCSQFVISPPTEYGYTAYNGYWSKVQCDCHKISSFQWIVNKLLIENNVSYRVEYSFPDLKGIHGKNELKFDFAILNEDKSIKCLIECQGEQHYMPVNEFGGNSQYNTQVKNDKLKKEYVKQHNIKLIEISYKKKKYDKIETILRESGII